MKIANELVSFSGGQYGIAWQVSPLQLRCLSKWKNSTLPDFIGESKNAHPESYYIHAYMYIWLERKIEITCLDLIILWCH